LLILEVYKKIIKNSPWF